MQTSESGLKSRFCLLNKTETACSIKHRLTRGEGNKSLLTYLQLIKNAVYELGCLFSAKAVRILRFCLDRQVEPCRYLSKTHRKGLSNWRENRTPSVFLLGHAFSKTSCWLEFREPLKFWVQFTGAQGAHVALPFELPPLAWQVLRSRRPWPASVMDLLAKKKNSFARCFFLYLFSCFWFVLFKIVFVQNLSSGQCFFFNLI